ncbi:dipeptide/oligopeptide/nickel ABC transporter permease/ATP-binding protein [Nesterenkonia salmonea]|uniref:Dipeptide/oligopeptide/nickel ABC transporter permease/ATP-binding protein n=1 Tax=Nesterenkonia salmonea TaxID=1804987 RepID=A0A5R9BKB7_9MICC|nr:dipeptide/oligopeptide/nickel ABC transporter permease/ATP-binding protein [Nesterenkonia salmonea]TLQ01049.1 dipeptide/oligopeptide/nickel ABC transporter permease/ATP-binding protein [Nesterenkonia salmonea]
MANEAQAAPTQKKQKRRLHPILLAGLIIMTVVVLIGIFAPMWFSESANVQSNDRRMPISADHPLGTDEFGRDLFSRALVATRLTLLLTVAASAISVVIGVTIGTLVWFMPPRVRQLIVGANSVAVAFPNLVIALIIAAILGPGAWTAAFAVGIASVPAFVRLTVNMSSPIMARDYVTTAHLLRVSKYKLIGRHVLPNMAEPLLILTASNFAVTLVELSGLSFIGLGVQSPDYDYGLLLSDALTMIYAQPTQVIGPAVMIVLAGLGAMLIGDGLAASSNPRTRGQRRAMRTGTLRPAPAAANEQAKEQEAAREAAEDPEDEIDVRVRDLRVTAANGTELVKGIDFDVRRREIVGLVGESGSGKSLTAMTLCGLTPEGVTATAGTLVAAGHNMLEPVSSRELAQDIALVYQDPMSTFNPALKLNTQLTEVARTHLGMRPSRARRKLIERFEQLKITSPEHRIGQHPHELSGGMLQRAMIASSLLAEAKLIVADEPTTALDVTVQAEVLRQFVSATQELDASVLFISHDLGVVEALCDRVLVMYRGEIVEELTAEQLGSRRVEHPYTRKLLDAAEYVEAL